MSGSSQVDCYVFSAHGLTRQREVPAVTKRSTRPAKRRAIQLFGYFVSHNAITTNLASSAVLGHDVVLGLNA